MYKLRVLLNNKHHINRLFCSGTGFNNFYEATKVFCPLLDMNESTMYKYLVKNSFLKDLEPDDVRRKIAYFKYLNATTEDILKHPLLFTVHLTTLENRSTILRECGFVETLKLDAIVKYVSIVRQKVKVLKDYKLIPFDLSIMDQLGKQFDIELKPEIDYSDDMCLQFIRNQFINAFLRQRLQFTDEELDKLWKTYSRIKHKSFGNTQRVIDILERDYKFSRNKIIRNLYLLHADPENLLRYPDVVPQIGQMDIRHLMLKQPKIMMVSCDSVRQILDHFRAFGIDEAGILKYSTILTLSSSTIKGRLEQLKKTKEFDVLSKHPRITKLIAYQTKATLRLDFLQQLKVRCFSLNILSSHTQNFEKYVRDGYDKTHWRDVKHYINVAFGRQDNKVLEQLKRHPYWFHVPVVQMQETLEYLKSKGFSPSIIYENIQIMLYPLPRISSKLEYLMKCKEMRKKHDEFGIELTDVTPSQMLSLCLYMIEFDFHFTGDGIWPEQVQHSDSATTTNIELPKSLSKGYRFGTTASEKNRQREQLASDC